MNDDKKAPKTLRPTEDGQGFLAAFDCKDGPPPNWVFVYDEEGTTIPFAYGLTQRETRAAVHARCRREGMRYLDLIDKRGRLLRGAHHDDSEWVSDFTKEEVLAIIDGLEPEQLALYMESGERLAKEHQSLKGFMSEIFDQFSTSARLLPRYACLKVLDEEGSHFHFVAIADTAEMAFRAAGAVAQEKGIGLPEDWGVVPLTAAQAVFCVNEYCDECSYEPTVLQIIRKVRAMASAEDELVADIARKREPTREEPS